MHKVVAGGSRRSFYYTHFPPAAQGVIFLICHLAVAPAVLAHLSPPPTLPLVHMAYVLDAHGALARAQSPPPPRGGLLGLRDCGAPTLPQPEALARAIVSECRRNGYGGVLADFDPPRAQTRLPFLQRLSRALGARGLSLYCPLALAVDGARLLVGTAVSGGSLEALLDAAVCRYDAPRLALDLERVRMDFPLPCPSGRGTPLTGAELLALRQRRPVSVYYSRELAANYFTYTLDSGTRFVLFDDAKTLKRKCALARARGIEEAFVMYPEVADLL